MNLDQLENEAENLKSLDFSQLSPQQLSQLVEKLSAMLEKSETLLTSIKIEDIQNDETDNS